MRKLKIVTKKFKKIYLNNIKKYHSEIMKAAKLVNSIPYNSDYEN
jgi:hypothetical protein